MTSFSRPIFSIFLLAWPAALIFFFTVVFSLFSEPSIALEPEQAGTVQIAVKDESNEERWRANYLGLKEVMLKLNGKPELLNSEQAERILKQNSRYLLQFSYDTLNRNQNPLFFEELDLGEGVDTSAIESIKVLKQIFDVQLLIKHMQDEGMPVWGLRRPEIMFWWVSEEQGQRQVVSDLAELEWEARFNQKSLRFFADKRGLPLRLPLMDLQDQNAIRVSDIWGGYLEALEQASSRYKLDIWVVGKNYYSEGEWQANWSVHLFGQQRAFKASSHDLRALQKRVVNHLSELMAQEFSVSAGRSKSDVLLEVRGVNSIQKFNALQSYLKEIFLIERVQLLSVKADQARFKLVLKEEQDKLERLFHLNKRLAPLTLNTQTKPAFATPVSEQTEPVIEDVSQDAPAQESLPVLRYEWL